MIFSSQTETIVVSGPSPAFPLMNRVMLLLLVLMPPMDLANDLAVVPVTPVETEKARADVCSNENMTINTTAAVAVVVTKPVKRGRRTGIVDCERWLLMDRLITANNNKPHNNSTTTQPQPDGRTGANVSRMTPCR